MNQHQPYPSFHTPQQQAPYGYHAQTTAYQYPPNIPPQIHQHPPNQQQQQPQQQRQQQSSSQPSQFFPQLPQGVNPRQHSVAQPRHPLQFNDAAQHSLPSTPGNGPGAPPPDDDSPTSNYEETLMNALRRETRDAPPGNANNAPDADDDDDDRMDDDDPDEPVYQLPPPPEAIYPNEVELEKAIHAWSLEHGYELVRRASKKNKAGQLYKRYFHCSKHGKVAVAKPKATDSTAKVRVNRKSNRIGCPMSLAAVAVDPHDPSGNWRIKHRKNHHNHPAVDAIKLAGHRRRARMGGVETAVDGLFAIGSSTGDVLKFLQRTNPDGLFNRTDVANMKLKFKKYGTCCQRGEEVSGEAKAAAAATKTGFPSACTSCRQKKTRCDSARPICGTCTKSKAQCKYDHEPHPRLPNPPQSQTPQQSSRNTQAGAQRSSSTATQNATPNNRQDNIGESSMMSLDNETVDPSFVSLPQGTPAQVQPNVRQVEQALAALASFQQEHVKPTKLTLESSSVEVLASSTCGNGDSYKSVTRLPFSLGSDWRAFRENFLAAAVKENTNEVLTGDKKEPVKPDKPTNEITVEEHNEYIKQLAIFKRRNEMLKIGIKESLHPSLWSRLNLIKNAHDIWNALEDMCMPRGSDMAYTRFNDLCALTLQSCGGNLDNYIHALETKHQDFNQMAHHHDTRRAATLVTQNNSERAKRNQGGNGTFPEEMLNFVFLRGLGEAWQGLAVNLCKKNNLGGYGSGERLGFRELCGLVKRAVEWEERRGGRG